MDEAGAVPGISESVITFSHPSEAIRMDVLSAWISSRERMNEA